jgi:hypothetical protein
MTRMTTLGLMVLVGAGYGSVARAQDKTTSPDFKPTTRTSPNAAQGPSPQVISTPEPKGTEASRATTPPTVNSALEPGAPTQPHQLPSKLEPQAAGAKASWDHLQPCQRRAGQAEHDLTTDSAGVFGVRGSVTHLSLGNHRNAVNTYANITPGAAASAVSSLYAGMTMEFTRE